MENWCGQRELDIAVDEHCTGAVHSVTTAKEETMTTLREGETTSIA